MTDEVAAEAVVDTPETPEVVENAQPSAEEKATRLGWRPKEDFTGDPERWVDAAEYLRRGEEDPKLVRANLKKVETALERAQARIATFEKTQKQLVSHLETTEKRAYERAKREIEARLDLAAEAGDVEGVRAATREITDLTKDMAGTPKQDAPADPLKDPEFEAKFEAWQDDNPWYGSDKVLTAYARGLGQELADEGMTPEKQLKEVAKRVRAEFPSKFTNPRRTEAAAVEGVTPTRKTTGKTYADLPADAKAMCDDFCKNIKGFTREKFVRDYQWS